MQNSQTPSLTRPVISPHKAFSFVVTWTTVWWISESLSTLSTLIQIRVLCPLMFTIQIQSNLAGLIKFDFRCQGKPRDIQRYKRITVLKKKKKVVGNTCPSFIDTTLSTKDSANQSSTKVQLFSKIACITFLMQSDKSIIISSFSTDHFPFDYLR